MIWLPTSAATQTLFTFTFLAASTLTSATSAKYPAWLKWNATPIAVPLGSVRLPQPDFSATSCSTPFMRSAFRPASAAATAARDAAAGVARRSADPAGTAPGPCPRRAPAHR